MNYFKQLIHSVEIDRGLDFADALNNDYSDKEIDLALKKIEEDGCAKYNKNEFIECLKDYKLFGKKYAVEKAEKYFCEEY